MRTRRTHDFDLCVITSVQFAHIGRRRTTKRISPMMNWRVITRGLFADPPGRPIRAGA